MELGELNLSGKVFLPELAEALVQRYRFISNNANDKKDREEQGLLFQNGSWQGHSIDKLCFNPSIIYLDGQVSTDHSRQMLIELLEWSREQFGTNYSDRLIQRWAYVSNIVFQTDFPLLRGQSPVLNSVGDKIASEVERNLKQRLSFQPSVLQVGHDPQKRITTIASFTIQHRLNTLFDENIFFSEAPVPTKLHLDILEEVEAEFKGNYESAKETIRRATQATHER